MMLMTMTSDGPRFGPRVAPAAVFTSSERSTLRLLKTTLVVIVFLQRVAIPVGQGISVVLPLTAVALLALFWGGGLAFEPRRTRLYLIAMVAVVTVTLIPHGSGASVASLSSLLLLLVTYIPCCLILRQEHRARYEEILRFFVSLATIVAVLALLQYGLQLVGWKYTDVLSDLLPPNWTLQGFSTSYPVRYGSPLYKSNAFLTVEPSACSQVIGLGIVLLVRRDGGWRRVLLVLLLLGALLTTVSGTGVLLVAAGMVGLAVKRGVKWTARLVVATLAAVITLSLTPAFSLFTSRATETKATDTSASLRFVQPYSATWQQLSDTGVLIRGNGPGSADRQANRYFANTGLPLLYATLPKLLLEYGAVAGAVFLFFIAAVFSSGPALELKTVVFVLYFLLGSQLLSLSTVCTGLLLTAWFSTETGES